MTLKNFYTATDIQPGDVFACVVTCHITERGYRLYRCEYDAPTYGGIPQGMNYPNGNILDLFPIVRDRETEEDK